MFGQLVKKAGRQFLRERGPLPSHRIASLVAALALLMLAQSAWADQPGAPPQDPAGRNPIILEGTFEIPSLQDEVTLNVPVAEAGLYSIEVHFQPVDPERLYDRLTLQVQSAAPPGAKKDEVRRWFAPQPALDPGVGHRFYFWVSEKMRHDLGPEKMLRVVLGRQDRERFRIEGEFEAARRVTIPLPHITGKFLFRSPAPVQVKAQVAGQPDVHSLPLTAKEIVQYQVRVEFPPLKPRARPYEFRREFRVPRSAGVLNADIGGVLLRDGRWIGPDEKLESGTYDFLVSRAPDFSKDQNGRRTQPTKEDWQRFQTQGMLFRLDNSNAVKTDAFFYLQGGDEPPDYYLVELEEIQLNAVPDEGNGPFWLAYQSAAVLGGQEAAPRPSNAFGIPAPVVHLQSQFTGERIAIPRAGELRGRVLVRKPLLVVPAAALLDKEKLTLATDPHYFHEMSLVEQARFIYDSTAVEGVVKGLTARDPGQLGVAIVKWAIKASKPQRADAYRTFGAALFETERLRGWALRDAPQLYVMEGAASRNTAYKEIFADTGRPAARVSALGPDPESGPAHVSTVRVRKVPGIWVDGAEIKILKVKTNRDFDGHLKVDLGVSGHDGGRLKTSGQGLHMETAAVNTPCSYRVTTIAERGPYRLRPGPAQAIDFAAIDFLHPDRDATGLWEQLRHTFGPWAALHITVAAGHPREQDGQGPGAPRKVRFFERADESYLTVYPYDFLYGDLRNFAGRDGDWLILRGTVQPRGHILDEVELEVRLKVQAR